MADAVLIIATERSAGRQSVFLGTATGAALAMAFRMSGALTPMFMARMGPSGSPLYQ